MGITALLELLASIIAGLKNSEGQPLVGSTIAAVISAGESVVASITADIQAAGTSGATSTTAVTAYLETIQVLTAALASEKVLSASTVALIASLDTALEAALAAEQAAQTTTDPSLLTPIPPAE